MENLFEYSFVLRSLLGALFASITAGVAGTYIVSRRLVFLSGGVTHASFGGIGLGYYFGINPVVGAAVFGLGSAIGMEYMSARGKMREDSAIGILWALGMAIGIIFIYLTPGYAPNLLSYLFGSILTVTDGDLIALGIISVVLIAYTAVFYRTLLYISFDESYARTFTRHVDLFRYVSIGLTGLAIVLNIRMAGVIMIIALLTIPANIVMLFTRRYLRIIVLSTVVSFFGISAGFAISWFTNLPTGATIVAVLVLFWLLARGARSLIRSSNIEKLKKTTI
ncbi:MAG TPA: metal ABC transporter permease [Bacteroidales bacterium]|jgi:zinc transport system permease protein|nr:MAG: Manganese transport system membrane protein MntB [Bacteroidetes bacterium ADurb.BinA012]HNV66356.1 metal ABC transporter permease [Bacteroidales bacterium]HOR10002.1 metal ABC transporter permease [Bacteroidales bacterium]HPH74990.1 metal ABC transporter permease [Bacteroidales bacterium]HPO41010.1 metal ABC transporter permease [Bacteroidales bacterium]